MFERLNIEALAAFSISLLLIFITTITILTSLPSFAKAIECPEGADFCGGTGIVFNPGGSGTNSTQKCANSINSCGTYPNCLDLSQLSYCVNGHVIESYCYNNAPKNRTKMTACTPNVKIDFEFKNENDENRELTVSLFSPGSTTNALLTSTASGNTSINSPIPVVDFKFDFDNSYLSVISKGVDLQKMQGKINKIKIEKVDANVPGVKDYKAYFVELPANFTFTSLTLYIKYSDVSVTNESALVLYRCSDYNFATETCNSTWELKSNVTRDTTNKIISLQLTGFSVYSLAEQGNSSTTTTTTTQTSSDDSNSGSSSIQNIYSSGSSSSSSVGQICNVNSDCCSGKTSGSYSCTPGGCVACDASSAACFNCAPPETSSTSSTTRTSTTSTVEKKKETGFAIAWPALSLPILIPLNQEMFFTFFVGFVSGFAIALFLKSGLSIQSLRPRYPGFPRNKKYYEGRYRSISNVRKMNGNSNRRSRKSFGETKLMLG